MGLFIELGERSSTGSPAVVEVVVLIVDDRVVIVVVVQVVLGADRFARSLRSERRYGRPAASERGGGYRFRIKICVDVYHTHRNGWLTPISLDIAFTIAFTLFVRRRRRG